MSRIIANNIRHNDATVDNITLDSAGNVSVPNDLAVDTDTLFVDASTDRVGINRTPGSQLDVQGANCNFRITSNDGNTSCNLQTIESAEVRFGPTTNSDLAIYTNGLEEARFLSGGGLTFNGDTAAANALDDYEEGTWTPQVLSGVTSPSYATQYGGYVKIGSLVYASWDIDLNGGTANTSHIQFGNFPFASESAAQQTFAAGVISYGTMFDQSTLHNLQLHMSWNGSTVVEVYNYGSTVRGNDSGVNILNRLIATIVYRTSA